MKHKPEPLPVGLDLNATRCRGVAGPTVPRLLALDGDQPDLPLYLGLERRQLAVGEAARARCRRIPHLTCAGFLPHLGTPHLWRTPRHTLDAAQALAVVFKQAAAALPASHAVILTYPGYLTKAQVGLLTRAAESARLTVAGTLAAPLAAAIQQPGDGQAVLLDVDDHALTCTRTFLAEDRVQVLERTCHPHLGLRAWRERLLDAVADRCIRRSRRDPRESSEAEQMLWQQLDGVLAACTLNRCAEVSIQAGPWYQDLVLRPEETLTFTRKLTAQALDAVRQLLGQEEAPVSLLAATAAAGQLPGLVSALHAMQEDTPAEPSQIDESEDFGENLLQTPSGSCTVTVLPEDALARAAWELAATGQRGPFETAAPRLLPPVNPARRLGTIA
jgi:hypothetical protein